MKIADFDTAKKVFIIAEIGNNHEGNFTLAKELIAAAAEAGADAVKFQTIIPEKLIASNDAQRIAQLNKFKFSYEQFEKLAESAKAHNICFLSTPFDLKSAEFLNGIVPAFKIASGDNTFFPLIEYLAATGKPLIMSTGLAEYDTVAKTVQFIQRIWKDADIEQELALLHCVASYPTSAQEANLKAIFHLKQLSKTVGYSDHTLGIGAAVLSVAMGARIIEKHFTVDNNYSEFRDHKISADPESMRSLIERVREAEIMLGEEVVGIQPAERDVVIKLRRSVAAARNLSAGQCISFNDLVWVRPGGGIAPGDESQVIGRNLNKDIGQGQVILLQDLS